MNKQLRIKVLEDVLGVCRLDKTAEVPAWAKGDFLSITKTSNELSIVCSQKNIPERVECEKGWRYFVIDGTLEFSLVGILASISVTLARRGISIFAISTYDTDYILVKEQDLAIAVKALLQDGYQVIENKQ